MYLEPIHKLNPRTTQFFRLIDALTSSDRGLFPGRLAAADEIVAIYAGETRCPRKGEWFLSGAVIGAYRAPNDLNTEYPIAKLVHIREEKYIRIIESATDNQPEE